VSELDHLIVAAHTLEEGARWIERELGVAPVAGGKHALMGTHNRLLALGRGRYLEVIAIDPDAPAPERARWLALDDPAMRARLAKGPALIHWVERTADLDAALRDASDGAEILSVARGPYRWRIGVRRDGRLPRGGAAPTLIQWEGAHPAEALPPSGVTLTDFRHAGARLEATFSSPLGARTIRGSGE
jgi:hypothetical protein